MESPKLPPIMTCLTVQDADRALEFYTRAFGFRLSGEAMKGPDGKTLHAEMTHGEGIIMLGPEGAFGGTARSPATSLVEPAVSLYVYVDEVEAHYLHARSEGATIVSPPADMFWGDRMYRVTCPDGHCWAFATHTGKFLTPPT